MKKKGLKDLGYFNGIAAFPDRLYVGRPNIGDRKYIHKCLDDILDRRWLTNGGKYVAEFENKIAKYVGTKHCIVLCNGTTALEIAFNALGLRGEVILPAFTFIATAHALQWQGIKPVFCDIDPLTMTIDPNHAANLINTETSAIVGVHLWGRGCDTDKLQALAEKSDLKIVYDACHAFGCSHNGQMIGQFGDAEIFSFHATKVFNSFEGGAIVTNNDNLAEKIRLMKNFGFAGTDQVEHLGINGKMNEMSAVMGLAGLKSLNAFVRHNEDNYRCYHQALQGICGIRLLEYDTKNKYNYHNIVVDVDEAITGISRDLLVKLLNAEGIVARRYFYPGCHNMEPYRSLQSEKEIELPVTERLMTRLFSLPTGTAITAKEIRVICEVIRFAVEHSKAIHKQLKNTQFPGSQVA